MRFRSELLQPPIAPNATQVGERTRRIVGLRLLPFVFILYIVNYVDRTNLAYAALGMSRDLGSAITARPKELRIRRRP